MEKNTIIEYLKTKDLVTPSILLKNYNLLNINSEEVILLIVLINMPSPIIFDIKRISSYLSIKDEDTLRMIYSLKDKHVLSINIIKSNNKNHEIISLDSLYESLYNILSKNQSNATENIFEIFEKEFGRTLSPMDMEIISNWINDKFGIELILAALREAKFNNVSSFRYIDTILYEWKRKGIKTVEDVKRQKIGFKKNLDDKNKKELFDYNWLDDDIKHE